MPQSPLLNRLLIAVAGTSLATAGVAAQTPALPGSLQDQTVSSSDQKKSVAVRELLGDEFSDHLQYYFRTRNVSDQEFVQRTSGANSDTAVAGYRQALNAWGSQATTLIMDGVANKSGADLRNFRQATANVNQVSIDLGPGSDFDWIKQPLQTGNPTADATIKAIGVLGHDFYYDPTGQNRESMLTLLDVKKPKPDFQASKQHLFQSFLKAAGAKIDASPAGQQTFQAMCRDPNLTTDPGMCDMRIASKQPKTATGLFDQKFATYQQLRQLTDIVFANGARNEPDAAAAMQANFSALNTINAQARAYIKATYQMPVAKAIPRPAAPPLG